MRVVVTSVLLVSTFLWTSPAAAVCGPTWLDAPPTFTYQDAPLRLHFYPDESKGCDYSLGKLDGQTISVTLGGETDPTLFKIKNVINYSEFIQDWTPVNGWGGRTEVKLPLDFLCYPKDPEKQEALSFSIQNNAAPVSSKVMTTLKGVNPWYIEVEVDPADPQIIYWATMTPTTYQGEMPLMISKYVPHSDQLSSGKSVFLNVIMKGNLSERCQNLFELETCTDYSITIVAEDLLGRRSPASDPIKITIGQSTDVSFWQLGDPLNCPSGSGCSCSNVGF